MNFSLLYTIIGFVLAAYSVISNDSIQTLGTFLASNKERFQWYTLWFAASVAMSFTLTIRMVFLWWWHIIWTINTNTIPRNKMVSCYGTCCIVITDTNRNSSFNYISCFISICHHRCIRKDAYKIYGGLRSCGIFRVSHLGTVRVIDRWKAK